MFNLIVGSILLLIAAVLYFVGRSKVADVDAILKERNNSKKDSDQPLYSSLLDVEKERRKIGELLKMGGYSTAILGVFVILMSMVTFVGTKDVGIITSFGRPTGRDITAGPHLKLPWHKVNIMDAAIQPDDFAGNECIEVRIGDGSIACANITIRWQIQPSEASTLFQNYRSDDVNQTIRHALVVTQLKSVLNDVLGSYNPLGQVDVAANEAQDNMKIGAAPNLDKFSEEITSQMNTRLAASNNGKAQIKINSVTLSLLSLSKTTQEKLNAYQAQVGQTRVAQQAELTAQAKARANKALADSVSRDPNVIVSQCMDLVEEAIKSKYTLPAGYSCWGTNSAVVIPGQNK